MSIVIRCPFYAAQERVTKGNYIKCEGLKGIELYRKLYFVDKLEKNKHKKNVCAREYKGWEQCNHAIQLLEQYEKK